MVHDIKLVQMAMEWEDMTMLSGRVDQSYSDRVWKEVVTSGGERGGVGGGRYSATIRISASTEKPWTIQALRPDGEYGTEYTFGEPRLV
jgi:hypothetical protein